MAGSHTAFVAEKSRSFRVCSGRKQGSYGKGRCHCSLSRKGSALQSQRGFWIQLGMSKIKQSQDRQIQFGHTYYSSANKVCFSVRLFFVIHKIQEA